MWFQLASELPRLAIDSKVGVLRDSPGGVPHRTTVRLGSLDEAISVRISDQFGTRTLAPDCWDGGIAVTTPVYASSERRWRLSHRD